MANAVLTDPRWARIWINALKPNAPPYVPPATADPGAKKFCAINSKALNQSLATGTAVVPDCDNPVNVSIIKRTAQSKDWNITGTGYFELSMRNDLQGIMDAGTSVPVVFEIMDDAIAPANAGYYKGTAFLETFNIIANNTDSYMTVDVTFSADGPITWVNAP